MTASQRAGIDLLNSIAMRPAGQSGGGGGGGVMVNQIGVPTVPSSTSSSVAAAAVVLPKAEQCVVCKYSHPWSWECPEMRSMRNLRVALDELKRDGRLTEEERSGWRGFLVEKLRLLRG